MPRPEPAPNAATSSTTEADAHGLGVALGRIMGGSRRTAKAAALVAVTRLVDGETVRYAVGGRFRAKDGVVMLTNRRLIVANDREWDPEVVVIDDLDAVQIEHWVERRAAILRITADGKAHVVDRINDLEVVETLVESVQNR